MTKMINKKLKLKKSNKSPFLWVAWNFLILLPRLDNQDNGCSVGFETSIENSWEPKDFWLSGDPSPSISELRTFVFTTGRCNSRTEMAEDSTRGITVLALVRKKLGLFNWQGTISPQYGQRIFLVHIHLFPSKDITAMFAFYTVFHWNAKLKKRFEYRY